MSDARLTLGTVLDGKWRVERALGEGGMGTVYEASHVRNGSKVAVKVLHPDLARDGDSRERMLKEGYAANRVNHPGVVRVLDDGVTERGVVYLVMELLDGKPLDAVADASGGALPVDVTMRYALQWLEVMGAAHRAGVIHRDLKPENVFIGRDGSLKVLDFGLARIHEPVSSKRLTTTGVPLGTPAFMPREQALAYWDEVDTRADVYSIGASLFTLLTGQLVHDGRSVPEIIVAVSTRHARPIRSVLPTVPAATAGVIDKALSFERHDRFADAGEMLVALRQAVAQDHDGETAFANAASGTRPPNASRSRALPIVAGAVLLGAVIGLAALLFWSDDLAPAGPHGASPVTDGHSVTVNDSATAIPEQTNATPSGSVAPSADTPALSASAVSSLPSGPRPATTQTPRTSVPPVPSKRCRFDELRQQTICQ